jgi:hypothetical protein
LQKLFLSFKSKKKFFFHLGRIENQTFEKMGNLLERAKARSMPLPTCQIQFVDDI